MPASEATVAEPNDRTPSPSFLGTHLVVPSGGRHDQVCFRPAPELSQPPPSWHSWIAGPFGVHRSKGGNAAGPFHHLGGTSVGWAPTLGRPLDPCGATGNHARVHRSSQLCVPIPALPYKGSPPTGGRVSRPARATLTRADRHSRSPVDDERGAPTGNCHCPPFAVTLVPRSPPIFGKQNPPPGDALPRCSCPRVASPAHPFSQRHHPSQGQGQEPSCRQPPRQPFGGQRGRRPERTRIGSMEP